MAKTTRKKSTSNSRSTSRSKVVPSRSKVVPSRATRKPTARKKSLQIKPISAEKKLDIVGIVLALVGLLTLISLLTSQTGTITLWWTSALGKVMGWGKIALPLGLIIVGGWMLLRNAENMPGLTGERILGVILLFVNLLAWLHVFTKGDLVSASLGGGGGFIGAWVKKILVDTLGAPGMIIILVAWLIISLVLVFDISVSDMARWLSKITQKTTQKFNQAISERKARIEAMKAQAPKAEIKPVVIQPKAQDLTSPPAQTSNQPPDTTASQATETGTKAEPKRLWVLPTPNEILFAPKSKPLADENDKYRAKLIEDTLKSLSAPGHVVEIRRGPSITMFGVEPDYIETQKGAKRVRVANIAKTSDDLAMALQVSRIRIQAPVPGKGYIGIEVPNQEIALVSLHEIITSPAFQKNTSPLKFALGKDVAGTSIVSDLADMPHLLIAGTTGAGKSVCINAILSCLLMTNTPDQLRLVLVDPKRVELTAYDRIPHLLAPVIIDTERVLGALQWMQREMDARYLKFNRSGTRNLQDYNAWRISRGEEPLPYLLLVIDELAEMMMLSPVETEKALIRLAQMARATGIHLIIATQRPSTDILTGLIKANFPARIAFAVFSGVDSRVILDQQGAERLLGKGDMLFQAPDAAAPVRLQGTFVSDDEISKLTSFWKMQSVSDDAPTRPTQPAAFASSKSTAFLQDPLWKEMEKDPNEDPMTNEVVAMIRQEGRASVSMLQRKFRIGYTRAARLVESLELKGIIGPPNPQTQVRDVLDYGPVGPPANDD